MPTITSSRMSRHLLTGGGFLCLLLSYHLIFRDFFPNAQGNLGHDYSGLLPGLLDGYYWFKNNSLFAVPWFTPSFCGGQPYFADVQSNYYSLQQLLTAFCDPLTSVYLCILLFASLGFWGMYLLLHKVFRVEAKAAFLAGSLFMFNGFYAHRMLVGHFGYQGFMLVPWLALLLLDGSSNEEQPRLTAIAKGVLAGFFVGYWLQAGLTSLMIPVSLSILAIACLYFLTQNGIHSFLCRSLTAILIALALSASKLTVGFAFMGNFERSDYLLPGINGIGNALSLLATTLFISPANIEEIALPKLSNIQWTLSRHEWEYGVTIIPLLLIAFAWARWGWERLRRPLSGVGRPTARSLISLLALMAILILPIAFTVYTPEWNAILKQMPLIKSSSTMFRWWLIYIPTTIVYASLCFDRLRFPERFRAGAVIGSVAVILLINMATDRLFYAMQEYPGGPTIIQAYQRVASGLEQPRITAIGFTQESNDAIASGISQLVCYNPSFGYQLEHLPFKTLHPGSIFDETNGYLNLKNPACYVFPAENGCEPGDHFTVAQRHEAELFASYKPFPFTMPLRQKIANLISVLTLTFGGVFLVFVAGYFTVGTRLRSG